MGGPQRVDRLATLIAFFVAAVSIVSAVVAGRAAVWSSTASDIDSMVLQEAIERQQIEGDLEIAAAADIRLAARYDTAYQRAASLQEAAAELREVDPGAAALLDMERQAAWGVDLALWRFFRVQLPGYDADGHLVFDVGAAVAAQKAADTRLTELRRSLTPGRAAEARDRTTALIAIAVLFVAALFVLTLAEVWPGRGRWVPLLLGVAVAVGAAALTVATDPDTAALVALVVAVAAIGLVLALAVTPRRWRRGAAASHAVAALPDEHARADGAGASVPGVEPESGVGAPAAETESSEGSARFRGSVALVLAAATLLGAGIGALQAASSDAGAAATREAQDQALLALTEHQRAMAWASSQVEVWSTLEEHRARADAARQLSRYLVSAGDVGGAAAAAVDAERWLAIAAGAAALTELSDDHPDGPLADAAFPVRYLVRNQEARAERIARQDMANEASAAWGARSAAYVAVLATIAIAAYLLGLSLVLRARRLRGMFAVVGVGLVLAATFAAVSTALEPSRQPDPAARDAIASAFLRARVAATAARTPADNAVAVEAYREVLGLHPDLARAHVELASALFEASSPQTTGYSSVATIDAVHAALAELERAAELGWDDLGTRADRGFYRLLVALADPAGGAATQAVADAEAALDLGPELPVLRYNHAAALLGDGRIEAARAAYAAAISATMATDAAGQPVFSEYERGSVSAGAITDLELIAASRAGEPEVIATVAELKAAIVAGVGDPIGPAAATSPVTVSGLTLEHDASQLWWEARIDDLDPARDVVSVLWLAEDRAVPGWHVLPGLSGPLRLGQATAAGELLENGAAPDYFGSQGHLLASDPHECVPDGRYRVELYLNGRLATGPITREIDAPDLVTEEHVDLGLLFCRPAGWSIAEREAGGHIVFVAPGGDPVMRVARIFRPDLPGEAGAAEVIGVMDAIAAGWPGGPAPIPGQEPVATWWMGLSHASVQWYSGQDGLLKVVAGSTGEGTVLAAAVWGTPDWVDGTEGNGILFSFVQQ